MTNPPANSIVVPFAWKNTIAIITQINTAHMASIAIAKQEKNCRLTDTITAFTQSMENTMHIA